MLWTSIVFGILHGPQAVLQMTVGGMVLGFIRFRTGSIYCCIAIHALHNFLVTMYIAYLVL